MWCDGETGWGKGSKEKKKGRMIFHTLVTIRMTIIRLSIFLICTC